MYKIVINMASGKVIPLMPLPTLKDAQAHLKTMVANLKSPSIEYYDTGNGVIKMEYVESIFIVEEVLALQTPAATGTDSNSEVVRVSD